MEDTNTPSAPTVAEANNAPVAPASAPAAAPVAVPPAAAPTTAPAAAPTDVQTQMAPYVAREQEAYQNAAAEAAKPVPVPADTPHARLVNMIQGLALGVSSFGKAAATQGREGGAAEVAQVQNEQARLKMEQQAQAQAQKNQRIQNYLTVGSANHQLAQTVMLLHTLPDEIEKSHLEVQAKKQTLATGEAEFRGAHGGMDADEFNKAMSDQSPVNGAVAGQPDQSSASSFFTAGAQQTLAAAKTAGLPDSDPYVQKLQAVLAPDSKATKKDVWLATQQLQSQQEKQKAALGEKSAREAAAANSPIAKLSTPEALAAPGAQAAIQAKIDDPTTDPNDVSRLRALLPQAAVAQFNAENIKLREARNQQIVDQGTPDSAGKALADRSLTLDELKTRKVTSDFIVQAVRAAQKYDPTFKAAESAGQARIAASAANQQFFGNTDSLLVRGGTLDQLEVAGKNLGNTQIPAYNSLANLRKAALGQGPQAAYAAAILGVADDYSKVMTGGQGSDTSRQQALDIISKNLSPEGRQAAIAQIKQAVTSQRNGRIGTNPYLRDMYPDPSTMTETPGVAGTHPAGGGQQSVGHKAGDVIVQGGRNFIVTAVDANGKVTAANPQQ